jgi:hypothetical protein
LLGVINDEGESPHYMFLEPIKLSKSLPKPSLSSAFSSLSLSNRSANYDDDDDEYYSKYLKYKIKYLQLKKMSNNKN